MAIANLLLSMSVYMLIPVLPMWLVGEENFSAVETGLSMAAFALGLYLLGPLCSFLVQRYRRNKVCLWAIVIQVVSIALLLYINNKKTEFVDLWSVLLERFALGAAFGLAQMVLSSTLVIDTCESFQRTEANHGAAWFGRFALSLGPLAGIVILDNWGFDKVAFASMGCAFVAMLLIAAVDFPFRAPEENVHVFSCDRFFLGQGFLLFVNLLMIAVACGILIGCVTTVAAFGMMMGGFLLALLAQRFAFRDAELKSEVVTGLILLTAALLLILTRADKGGSVIAIAAALGGMAIGIVASRFLLFFIKLSRHCQRGTSQSTFMLSWETGLALGVGICCGLAGTMRPIALLTGLVLTVLSLLIYNLFTHSWFLEHKNR